MPGKPSGKKMGLKVFTLAIENVAKGTAMAVCFFPVGDKICLAALCDRHFQRTLCLTGKRFLTTPLRVKLGGVDTDQPYPAAIL